MDTTLGRLTASLLALVLLCAPAAGAHAADDAAAEAETEVSGPTPLRLGFTTGDVRFWRPGTDDWVPAQVNIPLAPGDQLATDHLGNVEIQTGPDSFLRVWGDSRLALNSHDDNGLRLGVSNGYVSLDLRSVDPGQRVHLETAHATVAIAQAGYYRVDVSADRTAVTARRGGRATVTAHGRTVSVAADQHVASGATPGAALEPSPAPQPDAWDRWSMERTDTLLAAESTRYLAPQVYGAAELDRHGTWREEPTYGPVWEPRGVPAGWVPYSTGTWIADPAYGWTWVDTAPWGWAPYHHGRWVFLNGTWAWAPGPRVRAVYAPALVAFFGAPRPIGRPYVSWVALGWGEPLVPWWGRPGFIGRPWYAGWAGPRHWHRDHFHGRPHDYRNVGVRNAVVGMDRDRFGRERVERARISSIDPKRLQPVREPRPDIRDGAARRGTRPPGDDGTPKERPRERTVTLPSPPAGTGDEPPGLRPRTAGDRDLPVARPIEPEGREERPDRQERQERRGRVEPPQRDDAARPPRTAPPPQRTRTEQQWRRLGNVAPAPAVPRVHDGGRGERRSREAPARPRGDGGQSRGRR